MRVLCHIDAGKSRIYDDEDEHDDGDDEGDDNDDDIVPD